MFGGNFFGEVPFGSIPIFGDLGYLVGSMMIYPALQGSMDLSAALYGGMEVYPALDGTMEVKPD